MPTLHVIGLMLWRGGLLLSGGYGLYRSVDYGLALMTAFGLRLPPVPKAGCALVITGLLFVLLSLILERIQDARQERAEAL